MAVAPRIVNNIIYMMVISHKSDFAWQVYRMMRLQGDSCYFGHCK